MTKAKLFPYINRFSGEVKVLPKGKGKELNEDWARAKMATNTEGKKVFRFSLSSPVRGKDGKMHMATAIVDLSETDEPVELEVSDGKRKSK